MGEKWKNFLFVMAILTLGFLCENAVALAQPKDPLTYPEVITALQTKLPNGVFKTKAQLMTFVIAQVKQRKIDKPLTADREDDLRQAGATEELLRAIRTNSPAAAVPAVEPVDLGNLNPRAVNLVKPEYTDEARRARTAGLVKLALELDETGKVVSVTRMTVLPNGLTEQAVAAARSSTFRPATRNGKPARATGTVTYEFTLSVANIVAALANADGLRDRRDCDRAVAEYTRILQAEPAQPKALLGRGTCHLIESNYTLASSDFANGLAAAPRDTDLLFFLALALDFKGETAAAAETYAKAMALRPELNDQPVFQCLYIDRPQAAKDQARAAASGIINACERALRGAPSEIEPMLYFKRAIGYRLKGDLDRAISELENVRNSYPPFAAFNTQLQIAYNDRALEAFNKKDFRGAFEDVSSAIDADPQNPTPYINRCAIYLYARKQYREAIADCSAAIKYGTRSASAYTHRAYAYEMVNSRREAIADYKKALEIDPSDRAARRNLDRLESQRAERGRY